MFGHPFLPVQRESVTSHTVQTTFSTFSPCYFQETTGNLGRRDPISPARVHMPDTLMEHCGEGIICARGDTVRFRDTDGKFHQPPATLVRVLRLPLQTATSAQCRAVRRLGTLLCQYWTWESSSPWIVRLIRCESSRTVHSIFESYQWQMWQKK